MSADPKLRRDCVARTEPKRDGPLVKIDNAAKWDEVHRKRQEAEDYARKGDTLASALLDHEASDLAEELRKESR